MARRTPLSTDTDRGAELRRAIERTGYYPEVVSDGVFGAVAGEDVVDFYVHHEPTFDRDEIRRHLTVAVLTPSRLVLIDTTELGWQRARCRAKSHRLAPADPVLVGFATLQQWLWQRLQTTQLAHA